MKRPLVSACTVLLGLSLGAGLAAATHSALVAQEVVGVTSAEAYGGVYV